MDTEFQDIHIIESKSQKDIFVYRRVEIQKIDFSKPAIEVALLEFNEEKILILPKLPGCKILID